MGIIRNLATGQCIDLPAADVPAVGTAVNQYNCIPGPNDNQDFELVEQFGELMLRNLKTNYCLDLPGTGSVKPGAVVIVSPCQSGDTENQMFRAEPQTDGYYLRHVKSGLCLDVDGAGDDERNRPGQLLTVYTCSPDDDHIWTVG
nr:RICIN domain-containing protein [Kineosporia babensis]